MGLYDQSRKEVLEACLWLSDHGYFGSLRGTGGNVSLRTGDGELMAVTPSSVNYREIAPADICVVDFSGRVVEGNRAPSVESGLHAAVYRGRPDVNAVIHTHQTYGSAFAVLNLPIPALLDEVSFTLGESIDVVPYALSGSPELAANVAGKLGNNANAYIMQNHGVLALGTTMDRALLAAELLEKVARIYWLALSTGRPVTTLPADIQDRARSLRESRVNKARKKGADRPG